MLIFLAAILVVLDQLTKAWSARTSVPASRCRWAGFSFTYVENTGAAPACSGSQLRSVGYRVDGVILRAYCQRSLLSLLVYLLGRGRQLPFLGRFSLSLILAGAVGNLIDRFAHHFVIDFIHFRVDWFDFPVFNVADICVVVGALLLFVWGFLPERQPERRTVSSQE